jgi:hypothetical protein
LFVKFLLEYCGVDFARVKKSKKSQVPEIILHPAKVKTAEELHDSSKLQITGKNLLVQSLLDDPSCDKTHKLIIGTPESYTGEIHDPKFLADKIEQLLTK